MQEKPYPFGGKFLKTSFFILLLPQIQKNAVSLWQKKHASFLSTRLTGALTLSLPLTFGKKRKRSFLSLNRGISSIGRAIGSQSIGWEFESPMLHKKMKQLQAFIPEAFLFKDKLGGSPVGVGTVG